MKILHLSTLDYHGGAAVAAYRLLNGLLAEGVDAKMLVLDKETTHNKVISINEIKVKNVFYQLLYQLNHKIRNHYKSYKWRQYQNRQNIALEDIYLSYIENYIQKFDYDILHLHWIEGGFIDFTELQKINKPIVWTIHGSFPFTGICHHLICDKYQVKCGACPALKSNNESDLSTEMFELKKKRYANLDLNIISPSFFMAEKAKLSSLLGKRSIHVIPNGIDEKIFKSQGKIISRQKLNIKNKKTILFGAVGATNDENKGFVYLMQSLKILEQYYAKEDIQCLIFGTDNISRTFYETTCLGFVKDEEILSLAYSSADVMIVPSKHENLPYTIMESLSCETPVVAFNIGGNSDMIDHLKNGYLANPYSAEDLANGIKWCFENNQDNILGINARRKVVENYTLNIVSEKHIKLYEEILSNCTKTNDI